MHRNISDVLFKDNFVRNIHVSNALFMSDPSFKDVGPLVTRAKEQLD